MNSNTPPATLSAAALVRSALSSVKTTKKLVRQSRDSELKEQIADLHELLLDLKEKVLELNEQDRSLNQQLTQKKEVHRDPEFGYYFEKDDPDPLCPTCYETTGRTIHLPSAQSIEGGTPRRICNVCDQLYIEKKR